AGAVGGSGGRIDRKLRGVCDGLDVGGGGETAAAEWHAGHQFGGIGNRDGGRAAAEADAGQLNRTGVGNVATAGQAGRVRADGELRRVRDGRDIGTGGDARTGEGRASH